MADDTRPPQIPPEPPLQVPTEAPSVSDVLRTPRAPANTMPGGTAHTAGGQRPDAEGPSYIDAVRSLPASHYTQFYKRPCVRESQLSAISAGFVAGSVSLVLRRPVKPSTNWAVAAWAIVGCGHYSLCNYYRNREKDGMKQASELMERKRANIEAKKEARRKAREEQERIEKIQREEEERKKSWSYWANKNLKFW